MAKGLTDLIGVVVFAVVGIILDVAVLMPILTSFVTDDTDTTIATLLGIIPLFVALAILLAVAGSMVSYYKAGSGKE